MRKLFIGFILLLLLPSGSLASGPTKAGAVPVRGMVTMVDLGAKKCIPCKMMAPVLQKLEKEYKGRAAIVFLDVWEDSEAAYRFRIRTIPTQIFFDKQGNEVFRHEGYMNEATIVKILQKMGVN